MMVNSEQYQQVPSFLRVNTVFILSLVMILLGVASFYVLRLPLVIVSDDAFETLYGERRAANARLMSSFELLRPVRIAMVASSASAEAAADAAEFAGGGKQPAGVLFPDRYLAGARIYSARFPERKVFVIGDRPEVGAPARADDGRTVAGNEEPALIFFGPDREKDLYRAGMIAGLMPKQGRPAVRLGSSFNKSMDEASSAFSAGLASSGSNAEPLFLRPGDTLPVSAENISILVDGSPSMGLPSNAWISIPRIVFSWIDPGLADPSVLLLIDDSPYSLAAGAFLRVVGKRNVDLSPSGFILTAAGNSVPGLAKALRMMAKSSIP